MPRRSPFTALCGQLAKLHRPQRADLHIHTTASDGEYTPSQVVALARQSGLYAAAITDHDTLAGVKEAQDAASEQFEIIAGVEISAEYAGRELHILGYFIHLGHEELNARLARVCESRRERFRDYIVQLSRQGHHLPGDRVKLVEEVSPSLGRRHVASLLVATGIARNHTEAFHRFLGPLNKHVRPKQLVPVEEAIRLVMEAGGATSLAHPPDLSEENFRFLAGRGLGALEVDYAGRTKTENGHMRELAQRLGLAFTGGSDCHGPNPSHRRIGSHGITVDELNRLRNLCGLRNVAKC
jgi:predicted metal-dependent phosphoesterase TrpH